MINLCSVYVQSGQGKITLWSIHVLFTFNQAKVRSSNDQFMYCLRSIRPGQDHPMLYLYTVYVQSGHGKITHWSIHVLFTCNEARVRSPNAQFMYCLRSIRPVLDCLMFYLYTVYVEWGQGKITQWSMHVLFTFNQARVWSSNVLFIYCSRSIRPG
jgi:hypothetical protein